MSTATHPRPDSLLRPIPPVERPAAAADDERAARLGGLRRFAVAITLLNVLGHAFLGFEGAYAYPLVALATAYLLEAGFEWLDARTQDRPLRFLGGGVQGLVDFFLSAHISGLAISMLLYSNSRLMPLVFAVSVAIGSKFLLRARVQGRSRHVMNPSNLGIAATLLCFPWVGIAPPYQFTENLVGAGDWIFPAILIALGTFLNLRFTGRGPLIAAWLGGFVAQALVRSLFFDAHLVASLVPMTGLAFLLFTFYMVTDPATTPSDTWGQVLFGLGVAATYGLLMSLHVVFGLFFSLVLVCAVRCGWLVLGPRAFPEQRMRPAFRLVAGGPRS